MLSLSLCRCFAGVVPAKRSPKLVVSTMIFCSFVCVHISSNKPKNLYLNNKRHIDMICNSSALLFCNQSSINLHILSCCHHFSLLLSQSATLTLLLFSSSCFSRLCVVIFLCCMSSLFLFTSSHSHHAAIL